MPDSAGYPLFHEQSPIILVIFLLFFWVILLIVFPLPIPHQYPSVLLYTRSWWHHAARGALVFQQGLKPGPGSDSSECCQHTGTPSLHACFRGSSTRRSSSTPCLPQPSIRSLLPQCTSLTRAACLKFRPAFPTRLTDAPVLQSKQETREYSWLLFK